MKTKDNVGSFVTQILNPLVLLNICLVIMSTFHPNVFLQDGKGPEGSRGGARKQNEGGTLATRQGGGFKGWREEVEAK
jgi:hypothetical protein